MFTKTDVLNQKAGLVVHEHPPDVHAHSLVEKSPARAGGPSTAPETAASARGASADPGAQSKFIFHCCNTTIVLSVSTCAQRALDRIWVGSTSFKSVPHPTCV